MVECKESKAHQWVGVLPAGAKLRDRNNIEQWFAVANPHGAALLTECLDRTVLENTKVCGRVVTICGNKTVDKNHAYDATRQAMSATWGLARAQFESVFDKETLDTYYQGFALAVVVTTAKLFTARLSGRGELLVDVVPNFTVWSDVLGQHPVMVMAPHFFDSWALSLGKAFTNR